ncbi:transposase [Nitrosomonas mobilis]|nr:transposase [Nitrosomonas mobilis]
MRQVFHLPLRQTEGFMNSLAGITKIDITIPDFSSLSKRSIKLVTSAYPNKAMKPGRLVIVDSTGLKVYGKDE